MPGAKSEILRQNLDKEYSLVTYCPEYDEQYDECLRSLLLSTTLLLAYTLHLTPYTSNLMTRLPGMILLA
jgi:hypothetical protein